MGRSVVGEPLVQATSDELRARLAVAEAALAAERGRADAEKERADRLAATHERLLAAYRQLQLELKLLRKSIFLASAERIDTKQLELEFTAKEAELAELADKLGVSAGTSPDVPPPAPPTPPVPPAKPKVKPKGRRDVSALPIAEERVELLHPELEGKAKRIGFEESYLLGWRKGGPTRVLIARAKYLNTTEPEAPTIVTTPLPKRTFARSLAAPSLLAKIITDKSTTTVVACPGVRRSEMRPAVAVWTAGTTRRKVRHGVLA